MLATAASCGGKTPIQPDPPSLQLSCPTAIVREAATPQGADVHFDAPTPTGGRAPVNVQCDPGSGGIFAIGETSVRCTATDADVTRASCEFGVTVRVSRTIAKTRFLAFGDSITAGAVSLAPIIMLAPPDSYPFKLEQMLQQQYLGQTVMVSEQGFGGDDTRDGARKLPGVLDAEQPEVLLLLEGINNINALSTSRQASALRTMIEEAQRRRVDVLIATVMPVSPTWRHYQPGNTSSKIVALNTEIRGLAAQYQLGPPVDLFALFEANMHLIGADGLHPTVEGQTRIAEAFRDAIVRRYGSDAPTSLGFSTMRRTR